MHYELNIFAAARVTANEYKKAYDKADGERKAAWKDLNANYVPGSPKFKEYRDSIEPEFQEKIKSARSRITAEFDREYEKLRDAEIARVKAISSGTEQTMQLLGRLDNIPISADEFGYLVEQYGNHSYWVDRQLISLSTKNGIQECSVSPDITTKLGILDELKSSLYSYMDKYKNEISYSTDVLMADATIQKLEKRFTNNYAGIALSPREAGKRIAVESLNKADALARSMYLANALKTSISDVQEGILYELVKNHEEITEIPNMRLAGISAAMEQFRETDYKGICRAEETIEKINNETQNYERRAMVYNNLDDKYFMDIVGKSGSDELRGLVREMREVRKAGEEKDKREAAQRSQKAVEVQ